MNNIKQKYPCNLLQAIGLLLGVILLFIPIIFFAAQRNLLNSENFRIIFGTLFIIIVCLVPYIVNKKRGIILTFSYKPVKKFPLLAFSIVLVMIFQLGVSPLITSVFRVFSNTTMHLENPSSYTWFKLLSIILMAPAIEELFFRGIILNGFLSNYSTSKAIIFSALLFGAIHFVPSTICIAIILGLLLGWVYYQTKSLLYTTILHVASNIFGLIAVYFRLKTKSHTGVFDFYGHYTWYALFACLIIGVFLFVILYKRKTIKHETVRKSELIEELSNIDIKH